MQDKVRALVAAGPGKLKLRTLERPLQLPGGGIGRVLACAICGTDVSILKHGLQGRPIWPLILGHESIVKIEEIDCKTSDRWQVQAGDRVLLEEYIPCGSCHRCRNGFYTECWQTSIENPNTLRYGRVPTSVWPSLWGGFTEAIYIHTNAALHKLPDGLSDILATLAVPVANGLRWLQLAGSEARQGLVIVGPGSLGLGCLIAARARQYESIAVIGTKSDQSRLRIAANLGADTTLMLNTEEFDEWLVRSKSTPISTIIDASGSVDGLIPIIPAISRGGTVLLTSRTKLPNALLGDLIYENELTIKGVRGHTYKFLNQSIAHLNSIRNDLIQLPSTPIKLEEASETIINLTSSTDKPIHPVVIP